MTDGVMSGGTAMLNSLRVMNKQLYMLVQLAVTIAYDMELDKAKRMSEETEETLEVKRVLLGVYYFSRYATSSKSFPQTGIALL